MGLKQRRRRGFEAERELVKLLKKAGLWATRIPVSGVGQPLPDVLAARKGELLGFEVKRTDHQAVYYRRQFDNVLLWLEAMQKLNFKASAWLAVRFRGGKWRFYALTPETEVVRTNLNTGRSLAQLLEE